MIDFLPLTKINLLKFADKIKNCPFLSSDFTVGSIFMWDEDFGAEIAESAGCFIIKLDLSGETVFGYPFGGDEKAAMEEIKKYAEENDLPLSFYSVGDELAEEMKKSETGTVNASFERKWSDYLYSFEDIYSLYGGKFAGQRNHIHKFEKLYGKPVFEPLSDGNIREAEEMLDEYAAYHADGGELEREEFRATESLIANFTSLPLLGGVLRVNGKVAAVTVGEIAGRSLVIHVEKALKYYDGIYPAIFHSFVVYVKDVLGITPEYINREDDSGDEGLRKSKTQYHPVKMENKNLVKINSPLFGLGRPPEIKGDGVILNGIEERDKERYFALCSDEELNAAWGYDYKADLGSEKADADYFFGTQKSDFFAGTALSLAVREKAGGELIGEAVLYNFSICSSCEIGVRIITEKQGKGYGKAAFSAAVTLAEKMGLKVRAKCFKENFRSEKAILSSGLVKTGEDGKFYYFRREKAC